MDKKDKKGLKRIVVIDSFNPGLTMELKVDDHANFNGPNGAGKTTLLKLIPFFYGSAPARIMPKGGGKQTLTEYLLPRPTSVIVFEYKNHHGMNCVVVFRHASGTKPAYRFLGSGFDVADFQETQEGVPYYVEGRNLGKHWGLRGLNHSNQIESVVDYRAVIQGDHALASQSANPREMVREISLYSISQKKNAMRHMESITQIILERDANIESVRRLLGEIMRDNGLVLPESKLSRNLPEDIQNLQTLRKLYKESESFSRVIGAGTSYTENLAKMRLTYAQLSRLAKGYKSELSTSTGAIEEVISSIKVLKDEWEDREQALNSELSRAKSEHGEASRALDDLLEKKAQWDGEDIESKRADFDRLELFQEREAQARKRKDDLEGGAKELRSDYDARVSELVLAHKEREHSFQQKIHEFERSKASNQAHHNDRLLKLQDQHGEIISEMNERYSGLLATLREQISQAQESSKHPVTTYEERLEIAKADAVVKSASIAVTALDAECTQAEQAKEAGRKAADAALNSYQDAYRFEQEVQSEHLRLSEEIQPEPTSLMAELQRNVPGWPDSLGRLVRREVLLQKNMSFSAEPSATQNTFFGYKIDLDRLSKPQWAQSLESMQERMQQIEQRLSLAGGQAAKAKRASEQAREQLEALERVLDESRRKKANAIQSLRVAEESLEHVKYDCHERAVERQKKLKARVGEMATELKSLERQKQEDIARERQRHGDAKQESFGQLGMLNSEIDEQIDLAKEIRADESDQHALQLSIAKSDFAAKLVDGGFDEALIEEAMLAYAKARDHLAQVSKYRNVVDSYDHWKKTSWSRYREMTDRVTACELDVCTRDGNLTQATHAFNTDRRSLSDRQNALRDKAQLLRKNIEEAEGAIRLLPAYFDVGQESDQTEADGLQHLVKTAINLVSDQKTLMATIRNGIHRAENIICVGSDSSRLRRAWEALREDVRKKLTDPEDVDALNLSMTWALDQLMGVQLHQIREGDLVAVLNAGHQIRGFYSDLLAAQDVISIHAKKVSQEIVSSMDFEAISDVRINLINRIKEQDYWGELKGFVDAWDKWEGGQSSDLPPDALCDDLLSVSQVLSRSALRDSMDSVFDLNITLVENGRFVVAKTSADMARWSSTGLSFLVLLSIYAGISRMLCPDREVNLHWPVDELGVLSPENVTSLFRMLDQQGIVMAGGFPTSERALMQHFKNHHGVRKNKGIVEIKISQDRLDRLLNGNLDPDQAEEVAL